MTGELSVLDSSGDTRLKWDRKDSKQVEAARVRFEELRGKGYAAFKVTGEGGQGVSINEFDPAHERIIFHKPMVGG